MPADTTRNISKALQFLDDILLANISSIMQTGRGVQRISSNVLYSVLTLETLHDLQIGILKLLKLCVARFVVSATMYTKEDKMLRNVKRV